VQILRLLIKCILYKKKIICKHLKLYFTKNKINSVTKQLLVPIDLNCM